MTRQVQDMHCIFLAKCSDPWILHYTYRVAERSQKYVIMSFEREQRQFNTFVRYFGGGFLLITQQEFRFLFYNSHLFGPILLTVECIVCLFGSDTGKTYDNLPHGSQILHSLGSEFVVLFSRYLCVEHSGGRCSLALIS